jgi:hypothetical protein
MPLPILSAIRVRLTGLAPDGFLRIRDDEPTKRVPAHRGGQERRALAIERRPSLHMDTAFVLPELETIGTAICPHASSHLRRFIIVFSSHP